MSKFEIGMLAVSRAGHDLGQIYVIIREAGEYVYLADGCLRGLNHPKKKNKKHIQLIRRGTSEFVSSFASQTVRNEDIKRMIKIYRTEIQKGGNTGV